MKLSEKLQLKGTELYVNGLSAVEKLVYGVTLNPFSRDLWHDPYAYHNRMREIRPIHYSLALRAYWVTRFDWVQEILKDKRFGADVRKYPKRVKQITRNMDEEHLHNFYNPSMLDLDPPDHSRVRRLVAQGFMHKFIQSLEPRIREIVRDCLRAADNEPVTDVMGALAKPLPAIVIAEMLGLPQADHDRFQSWSEDLIDGTSTNDSERPTFSGSERPAS
jgi:cytochrome P450